MHLIKTLQFLSVLSILALLLFCSQANQESITAQPAQEFPGGLVLEGATLISPERSEPLADSVMLLESLGERPNLQQELSPARGHILPLLVHQRTAA